MDEIAVRESTNLKKTGFDLPLVIVFPNRIVEMGGWGCV